MAFMQWAPEMSVGLNQLDEDHRYLIKIINDLANNAGQEAELPPGGTSTATDGRRRA